MVDYAPTGIEAALERRYARGGMRYAFEVAVACWLWMALLLLLGSAGLDLLLGGAASDLPVLIASAEALLVIAFATGLTLYYRRTPHITAWLRGERSVEAARVAWPEALAYPVRAPATVLVTGVPFLVAWAALAAAVLDTGLTGVPVVFVAASLLVTIGAAVVVFALQLVVRPGLRELAAYLPADVAMPPSRFGQRQQIVARLVAVGLATALLGGGTGAVTNDPLGRLTLLVTLAPALLALVGGIAFPAATASLLAPVNELTAANRRVADGDLAVRVPVVSGDELGELAASFNAMVDRLQRHDGELRESRTRIVAAADGARRQVERDLHDGAQQQLVMVQLKLGALRTRVQADPEAAALTSELRDELALALTSLRDLAHGIYPAVLEADGLPGAIAEAAQRAAIPTTVDVDGVGRLPADLEAAIYFCCLEALQNAGKHAGPDATATVTLARRPSGLAFSVADDGRGYDTAATDGHAGVQNMADRIGALGGTLRVESAPGRGTTVRGDVPLSG